MRQNVSVLDRIPMSFAIAVAIGQKEEFDTAVRNILRFCIKDSFNMSFLFLSLGSPQWDVQFIKRNS